MTWTWILNPNETNGEQLYNCEERRRNSLWVFAKSKSGLRATHHRHWHWHGRHRHHGRHGHRWHHRPRSLVIFSCFDISTFTVGNGGNGGTPQCLAAVAPGQIDEPPKILKEVFLKSVTVCDPSHCTFICSPSAYLWWWHHGFVLDNTCHSTVYLKFWRWGVIIVGTCSIILITLDK